MNEPLIDVTGARRERERRRWLRRFKIAGIVAGVLGVVGLSVWLVWWSPVLAVEEVRVTGVRLAATDAVVEAAAIELGTPLARVDAAGAAERVVKLPEVASVDVSRSWPHAITITVHERVARLAVANGSGFDLVDATGKVFATVAERPAGVPLAKVPTADQALLKAVARVADLLPDSVRSLVAALSADSVDAITLQLEDGRRVIWGDAANSELKAKVLEPLLTTKAKVYDVSAPTHPITHG